MGIASLKSKRLGLKGDEAPAPKAKATRKDKEEKRDPVKFTYFPLWAKGPAIALALEHSGIEWVGEFPDDWKGKMKANTPWLELPVLDVPGIGVIGHETAILNYVGRRSKKMDGFT